MTDYFTAVISTNRPGNVPKMQSFVGPDATWFVRAGEEGDYAYAGASHVVPVAGNLPAQRNAALEAAFALDLPCAQFDDDLASLHWTDDWKHKRPIGVPAVLAALEAELLARALRLGGGPPTDNMLHNAKKIQTHLIVLGSLTLHLPHELRYDLNTRGKDDMDMSMQHIATYGGALRLPNIIAKFAHQTNRGGLTEYRTPETEQAEGAYLRDKWTQAGFDSPYWRKHYGGYTFKEERERRAKITQKLTGRALSARHKARISQSKRGVKLTDEAKQKIAEAKRGKARAPHTAESKQRISDGLRRAAERRKNQAGP